MIYTLSASYIPPLPKNCNLRYNLNKYKKNMIFYNNQINTEVEHTLY